jgi:hypothetical protein
LVLALILAALADLKQIASSPLRCTYAPDPPPPGAYESDELTSHVRFCGSGNLPDAYVEADKLHQKCVGDLAYWDYVVSHTFKSDSKHALGRALLTAIAPSLSKFLASLTTNCQSCSRALSAQGEYDLGYPPVDEASFAIDVETDRDIVVFGTWGIVYLLMELLGKSNIMDRELVKYLIIHTSGVTLPAIALQSFAPSLKALLAGPKPSDYLIAPAVNRRGKAFAAATAIGLHVATTIISHDLATVRHLVPEKTVRNIFTLAELSESKLIMREAAYALSHFLRVIPKPQQGPKLVAFIYQNLVEFELLETWAFATTPEIKRDPKAWIQALKTHCNQSGLKTLLPD